MRGENEDAVNVGSRRQLFLDERLIEKSHGIRLKVHRPRKTGEMNIFRTDSPYRSIGAYSSVMHEGGVYRMWYTDCSSEDPPSVVVRYAESGDGIDWEEPDLGLAAAADGGRNNIVLGMGAGGLAGPAGDGSCMVFLDPNAGTDQRYKMLARPGPGSSGLLNLLCSPDGIHWSAFLENVLHDEKKLHLDSQNVIFWDDRIRKYVCYVRRNHDFGGQFRAVARAEAEADGRFVFPKVEDMDVVLWPDRMDMLAPREGFADGWPTVDFYTNAAMKYPWAENAYFMFPTLYHKYGSHLPEFSEEQPINAGPIDIRFAASRDGIRWQRYDRSPYVGLGKKADFDSYSLYMLHGMVPGANDDLYLYYLGSDMMHGWNRGDQHEERENRLLANAGLASTRSASAISRLVLRRDGFVSVNGAYSGGALTTPPMRFDGDTLVLNVDTSAGGTLRVGVLDELDRSIEGHALADCDCIHTANEINRKVSWNRKHDLSRLAGRPVKLHFELRDTDLYAFEFMKS